VGGVIDRDFRTNQQVAALRLQAPCTCWSASRSKTSLIGPVTERTIPDALGWFREGPPPSDSPVPVQPEQGESGDKEGRRTATIGGSSTTAASVPRLWDTATSTPLLLRFLSSRTAERGPSNPSKAGPAALAKMRAEGRDPTTTRSARERLGRAIRATNLAAAEWNESRGERPDPDVFRSEILPGLEGVTISAIMRATGLSKRHSSRIRRGLSVPHPRHWNLLRTLVSAR
jgi:hypothetical protein